MRGWRNTMRDCEADRHFQLWLQLEIEQKHMKYSIACVCHQFDSIAGDDFASGRKDFCRQTLASQISFNFSVKIAIIQRRRSPLSTASLGLNSFLPQLGHPRHNPFKPFWYHSGVMCLVQQERRKTCRHIIRTSFKHNEHYTHQLEAGKRKIWKQRRKTTAKHWSRTLTFQ